MTEKLNEQLCKHSYYEATERIARMACFSTSRNIEKMGNGEYQSVAEELAHKDLIVLAISIRRLAELTNSQNLLKQRNFNIVKFESYKDDEQIQDNCWNALGNIIHGQKIEITKLIPTQISGEIYEMIRSRVEVDAIIEVKSDKHHNKMFSSVQFLKELGPVDKVDSQISRSVIQDCLLGGSFGSRRPDRYGMADH